MSSTLLQRIITADNNFYQKQGESFHRTRQHSWPSWGKITLSGVTSVLDVAGGNGRFYQFLQKNHYQGTYLNVDASTTLLQASGLPATMLLPLDILVHYDRGQDWRDALAAKSYDLICCFGFLHHVPQAAWREQLLRDLLDLLAPGGQLWVSFWQFIPQKSNLIIQDLGGSDYWLSWQGGRETARFAHFASDDEIQNLIKIVTTPSYHITADFHSRAPGDSLNHYVSWQKSA